MAEPLLLGRYHDAVTDALKKSDGCVMPVRIRNEMFPAFRA